MSDLIDNLLQGVGGNDDIQQKLNNLLPSIVYVYTANNKKLNYINKTITDLLGYDLNEIQAWDDDFANLVFRDDADLVKRELARFSELKDNETYSYNCRLNHKKGQWKYFRTKGTVLKRNDQGSPDSLLFIAEDISDHIECTEEVAAKKELIEETEKLLEFGTWNWDAVTNKTKWSAGIYQVMGYKPDDASLDINIDFYLKHVSKQDLEGLIAKIQWGIENKEGFEHIHTITTFSGEKKVVSSKSRPVLSSEGVLINIIGTVRDITDQIAAQKDLLYYRQMTLEKEAFLNSGSWETDVKTGISTWSDGMFKLFGYNGEAERQKLVLDQDFYYSHQSPGEILRSKEEWGQALKDQDSYLRESIITTKDGKTRLLETYGKVIRDESGAATRVIGTSKDITRLKEYERELEWKVKELERSNAELEEFAYVASHDLQEPLRKIIIYSERLNLQLENNIGSEVLTYLKRMIHSAENMRILIDNLLDFSRLNKDSSHFERTDLNQILKETESDLELDIEDSNTRIDSGKLPTIDAVPIQMKQLFYNLLLNAIKFRKVEGINIVQLTSRQVPAEEINSMHLNLAFNYYEISIHDSGIGFEQQYAEKIFQIFTRLNGKSEYPGTGIGLAICKKIIDTHGGRISATGSLGKGAVFTFILPESHIIN
jgi:PAS domain S-box-containing protein